MARRGRCRVLVVLLGVLVSPAWRATATVNSCLDQIRSLSPFDRELSGRLSAKLQAAQTASTGHGFVQAMLDSNTTGSMFSCGNTRSWVTEVFEGLGSQFLEIKRDDGYGAGAWEAGYQDVGASDIAGFFQQFSEVEDARVIYHMRHVGTSDHVWAIEQLPQQGGFRVYQSYNNAYSLGAWLAEDGIASLYKEDDTGDIMKFRTLQQAISEGLSMLAGKFDLSELDQVLSAIPEQLGYLRPMAFWVLTVTEQDILAYFISAWGWLGKGQTLGREDFFDVYLAKTASLVEFLADNDRSQAAMSQEAWDTWVQLYGSPNPQYFPGVPMSGLAPFLDPLGLQQPYKLQILPVVISGQEVFASSSCAANAMLIGSSLTIVGAGALTRK